MFSRLSLNSSLKTEGLQQAFPGEGSGGYHPEEVGAVIAVAGGSCPLHGLLWCKLAPALPSPEGRAQPHWKTATGR